MVDIAAPVSMEMIAATIAALLTLTAVGIALVQLAKKRKTQQPLGENA